LLSLPTEFYKPSRFSFRFRRCFHNGAECVSRRAKFVRRDVGDYRRLPRRKSRHSRRLRNVFDLLRCVLRRAREVAGLHHFYTYARPSAGGFYRLTRAVIVRAGDFKNMQNVFGALRRPKRQ
jgi:hypothetical protein